MSITFNADEIFEMAAQIERNGARFYRRAAKGAAASSTGELLLRLAAMEEDHEKTFVAMRAELTEQERRPTVYDPDGVAAGYLQAMADGKVFDQTADPSKSLTGQESNEQILRTAVGLEKDSIVFYLGMKEIVPERLGKDKLDTIIQEEMGHIVDLSKDLAAQSG